MLSRTTPQEPRARRASFQFKATPASLKAGGAAPRPLRDSDLLALVPGGAPAGLGGCRARGQSLDQCDYNLTVFDGPGPDEYRGPARISHAALSDMRPERSVHYLGMRVLRDESWDLRTALASLKPGPVLSAYSRGRAVEASMCCARAESCDGPLSALWAKAGALHLAEAAMAAAGSGPSPTHGLAALRGSPVLGELGLERASPTLLGRMCESVVGISRCLGSGPPPEMLRAKREAMASAPAACYLYFASLAWRLISPDPAGGGLGRLARVAMDLDAASPGSAARVRRACARALG